MTETSAVHALTVGRMLIIKLATGCNIEFNVRFTVLAADWLRECLKETLQLRDAPQRLAEVSFGGVTRYIKAGKARNVITMAGAGISTGHSRP